MKTLTFKNTKTVDFVESSTLDSLVTVVSSFADLDAIRKEFMTADNLIGGTFDGETVAQRVYTGVTTSAKADGDISATFTTRPFTHDEVVDARLADLEQVVADM